MIKRLSLGIPQNTHEQLVALSDFYKQDVAETINNILDVVGHLSQSIITIAKEYQVPVTLNATIQALFETGIHSTYSLFNVLLENLGVKGLFALEDFDIKLDEKRMWFLYDALVGCDLYVDQFDVTVEPGVLRLTTTSFIDVEKVGSKALEELKTLVQTIEENEDLELPEEFYELEDYSVEVDEGESDENWTLTVDCTAESFDYSPTVRSISEFVGKIFEKAGIPY